MTYFKYKNMSKKFRISEEQYNKLLDEDITLNADVSATNGNIAQAVSNTQKDAKESGVDLSKATIQVPAKTNEGKVISYKQLVENRLKVLKQNSTYYTFKDFIRK